MEKCTSSERDYPEKFDQREADATLLIAPGRAIRFDLGFIGRGNPEITKDKVSRFERNLEIQKQQYNSSTCIIIDQVGETSGLEEQARRAGAVVIQMSMDYWSLLLATWLRDKFNYQSKILSCPESDLPNFFQKNLSKFSLENFLQEQKNEHLLISQ